MCKTKLSIQVACALRKWLRKKKKKKRLYADAERVVGTKKWWQRCIEVSVTWMEPSKCNQFHLRCNLIIVPGLPVQILVCQLSQSLKSIWLLTNYWFYAFHTQLLVTFVNNQVHATVCVFKSKWQLIFWFCSKKNRCYFFKGCRLWTILLDLPW